MSRKQRVLFLCYRVARGYGVEAVLLQHARALKRRGHEVHIVCVENGSLIQDIPVQTLIPEKGALMALISALRPTHVVAHTEPWMSLLAETEARDFAAFIWEHGDPTPELIPDQKEERTLERNRKVNHVYPKVDRVFAISEFIRSDIRWPEAQVVYNGLELIDEKPRVFENVQATRPLRVGALMRLGVQEAKYKGADLFLELVKRSRDKKLSTEFFIMGKGSERDARAYKENGIETFLNASEAEKIAYLKNLDVFVTTSLWEGFNLPVVEAQSLGVPSLAFDVGAHPEVCPLVFSSAVEMTEFLLLLSGKRELLSSLGRDARAFVERRFSYERAADAIESAFEGRSFEMRPSASVSRLRLFVLGAREGISNKGFVGFLWWYAKKAGRRILKRV